MSERKQCRAVVHDRFSWGGRRCGRFAVDGIEYCRQHDPVEEKRRRDEKTAKWDAERTAKAASAKLAARKAEMGIAAVNALIAIAGGGVDPRVLAAQTLAPYADIIQEEKL